MKRLNKYERAIKEYTDAVQSGRKIFKYEIKKWTPIIEEYAWQVMSKKIREENPKCMRCSTTEKLHVHHVFSRHGDTKYLKFEPLNLAVVCMGCHQYADYNESAFKELWIRKYKEENRAHRLLDVILETRHIKPFVFDIPYLLEITKQYGV